jgi:DNA-binding transcriptional MocR family regulator
MTKIKVDERGRFEELLDERGLMNKATVRINEAIAAKLMEMGNLSGAATWIIEAYWAVREYGVERLKKLFTPAELTMIIDAENGLLFSPRMIEGYVYHLEDALKLDALKAKYGIEDSFMEKVRSLPKHDLVILHEWANYFWYGKWKKRPTIAEYIS